MDISMTQALLIAVNNHWFFCMEVNCLSVFIQIVALVVCHFWLGVCF